MYVRNLAILACLTGALSLPAFAEFVIDFGGTSSTGGAITGNSAGMHTTTGITIKEVSGDGGTQNDGQPALTITGGLLNINATGGSVSGSLYTYTGGTFDITGGIADLGIANGSQLLTGTITTLTVDLGSGKVILGTGTDSKNRTLVDYYCPSCDPNAFTFGPSASVHLKNITGPNTDGVFTAQTYSADIPNTYVPEPASVVLFGTVLVGITGFLRRKAGNKA